MRDRREDLGRLAVILDNVLENEIFQEDRSFISESYSSWFFSQTDEKRDEILGRMTLELDNIESQLMIARAIALGIDELNGKDHE